MRPSQADRRAEVAHDLREDIGRERQKQRRRDRRARRQLAGRGPDGCGLSYQD